MQINDPAELVEPAGHATQAEPLKYEFGTGQKQLVPVDVESAGHATQAEPLKYELDAEHKQLVPVDVEPAGHATQTLELMYCPGAHLRLASIASDTFFMSADDRTLSQITTLRKAQVDVSKPAAPI